MPDPKEIRILAVENELHTCPDCGNTLGFHTSFTRAGTGKNSPVRTTRAVFRVILICPECGARFDVGWRVPLGDFESRIDKAAPRPATCMPHGNPADCLPAPPPHDRPPER